MDVVDYELLGDLFGFSPGWVAWAREKALRHYGVEVLATLLTGWPALREADPRNLPAKADRILVWLTGWDIDTADKIGALVEAIS
jgi:hypothetical protein